MSIELQILIWPAVACLVLSGLLVYLGLHIVRRGVIFVDLALAQVATLGTCLAILLDYEPHDWRSYLLAFGFTLVGAAIFTLTRTREHHHVPQEALIGITYVVAAATAILMLNNSPHGNEELKETLIGDPLHLQEPKQVLLPMALYAVIALIHFIFRKKFAMISFAPEHAEKEGISIRSWDFLFYALFGLVVTTFVRIGGVLLVFSYLIIPAVCANFLARRLRVLLLIGWLIASIASAAGIYASSKFNLPMGAAIVAGLGACLIVCMTFANLRYRPQPK
jgi:zinc/manganese transport system permease protein